MPLVTNPQAHRDSPDDLSNRIERTLIGAIGLFLPTLLVLIAAVRPEQPGQPWKLLSSISGYYYTGAVAAFVGLLVTLALFLFAYRGYNNRWRLLDITSARVAAVAALGVAFFPTTAPDGFKAPGWWMPWMATVHYTSATVLFSSFAFFALFLFRRTDAKNERWSDKWWRDAVYMVCGLVIAVSIVWAGLRGRANQSIFVPESTALVFFAISWLVKGHALDVVWRAFRQLTPAAVATS
jgi:hypothetical protein